jgi:formylglycine-generating enzyme required for sulfatase activity
VTEISWRDAVVWCNAYSEAMGKTPAYKYAGSVLRESNHITGKIESAEIDSAADGFRLPTEAEWEYAARGGSQDAAAWAYAYAGCNSETDLKNYAWYSANSSGTTHAVKGKMPNRLGLYDMSGNVWEWCGDRYYNYDYVELLGYAFEKIKGGGFYLDEDASSCDIGTVQYFPQDWYFFEDDIGFRVACNP